MYKYKLGEHVWILTHKMTFKRRQIKLSGVPEAINYVYFLPTEKEKKGKTYFLVFPRYRVGRTKKECLKNYIKYNFRVAEGYKKDARKFEKLANRGLVLLGKLKE